MPPTRAIKPLAIAILIFAFIGFLDATYLTIEHYHNVIPPCSLTSGCEAVLTSEYNNLFGIPLSLFGAAYYLLILIITFDHLLTVRLGLFIRAAKLTLVGFLMSLYLVSLQLFVLKSICIYCMLSAVISITLFVLGSIVLARVKSYATNLL